MKNENYILGLDLGVGSIGWSCMKVDNEGQPCRLIAANSYIFPSEKGSMEDRRNARGLRRLNRRRKGRIQKVKSLFQSYQYMEKSSMKDFYEKQAHFYQNPYELKCKGLSEKLDMNELYICLIHYAKYRGFRSNRKANENAKDSASATEEQKLLYSIGQTLKALTDKGYTISQYITADPKFQNKIKNTDGAYHIGITRQMIVDEVSLLLDKQIELGLISDDFKKDYLQVLTYQRSFSDGPNEPSPYAHPLEQMIGKCSFDKNERAPLTAPSYELFILFQKLQNITFYEAGTRNYQKLNQEQIHQLVQVALTGKEIKYKDVFDVIGEEVQFKGLVLTRKDYEKAGEESSKHPEKSIEGIRKNLKLEQSIYQMKSFKYIQKELKRKGYKDVDMHILDEIAVLLSKYKSDYEISNNIQKNPLLSKQSDLFKQAIQELDESKFKEFGKLSMPILYKLLPFMKDDNLMYSEAMNALGYDHSKRTNEIAYEKFPPLEEAFKELELSVTNRSAIATLQETKRIINAILSRYGKPKAIHVEVARELTKNKKERYQLLDQQINNKVNNMEIKMLILNKFPFVFSNISAIHFEDKLRYRLYIEQKGIDPYTLLVTGNEEASKIKEKDLFSRDYEIDHILPYSKSFNDTMSNKVLVSVQMNQHKGNKVPMEAFTHAPGFPKFLSWLKDLRDIKKKSYLTTPKITEEMQSDFEARSLNDTRYATKVLCDILKYYFPDIKIRSFTGQITSKLKGVWGLKGYTHSYDSLDYRPAKEDRSHLEKLQLELSCLAEDKANHLDQIATLKKEILSIEKELDTKDRNNHLHHALDATIIACATDTLRRRVEIHEQDIRQKTHNVKIFRKAKVDPITGEFIEYEMQQVVSMDYSNYFDLTKNSDPKYFPKPYIQFHDEIVLRIYERDEQVLRDKLCTFTNYTTEERLNVHPLCIAHKCDKKANGRLHKATIYGVAPNPEKEDQIVLTNRMRINAEQFDMKKLENLYDKEGTQKPIYEILKDWLSGYKNGQAAFIGHGNKYPKNKNGNEIQKIKINYNAPKEEICIHEEKMQYVEKENVVQVHVYKKEGSDKLYFIGMDRYRLMNFTNDPSILIWSGRAKNYEILRYGDLNKNGYSLYKKLYKNQIIEVTLRNGGKGLCKVVGFSSGKFEIGSILGDASDLIHEQLQTKIMSRLRLTISTIQDIKLVSVDVLGNIRR